MSALDKMKKRMNFFGENSDIRNVDGKYRSFKASLTNSYQAENIHFKGHPWRCLINPDKLTLDYDQKEISIDFKSGMKNGDVFYWDRVKTHWIVYNQRLEEEAYFRATIRQCDYQINTDKRPYWIYVRGPVETALVWKQKHKIEFNEMNYSIMFYVTKNEDTVNYFSRLQVVKFDGHNWRVAATDKYSDDGVIQVYLEEYYDNEMEDNMVEAEIVKPDPRSVYIEGEDIVHPYDENLSYFIKNCTGGTFVVNSDKVKIVQSTQTSCVINILARKPMDFKLSYMKNNVAAAEKTISIKSY